MENKNLISARIGDNVSVIDRKNCECVILQYANRYGFFAAQEVLTDMMNLLDSEHKAASEKLFPKSAL